MVTFSSCSLSRNFPLTKTLVFRSTLVQNIFQHLSGSRQKPGHMSRLDNVHQKTSFKLLGHQSGFTAVTARCVKPGPYPASSALPPIVTLNVSQYLSHAPIQRQSVPGGKRDNACHMTNADCTVRSGGLQVGQHPVQQGVAEWAVVLDLPVVLGHTGSIVCLIETI